MEKTNKKVYEEGYGKKADFFEKLILLKLWHWPTRPLWLERLADRVYADLLISDIPKYRKDGEFLEETAEYLKPRHKRLRRA